MNYTPAAGFKLHRGFVLLADGRCAIFMGPISFASDPKAVSKIYRRTKSTPNGNKKVSTFQRESWKILHRLQREREKRRMELELRLFTQRSNPVSAAALSCAPNLRPTKCSHDKEINCFARCLLIPEQQPAYLKKSRLLSAPSARSLK